MLPGMAVTNDDYPLTARRGVAFERRVQWSRAVSPLSDFKAIMQIRPQVGSATLTLEATTDDDIILTANIETGGTDVIIGIGASDMDFPAGNYEYEIQVQHKTNADQRYFVMAGPFIMHDGVIPE